MTNFADRVLHPLVRLLAWPRRALDAAQRRFQRGRRGSVLIMVVSLLVLLALIGTAYIATTRMDRFSSQQNVANTQIDLLVEGLVNITKSTIVRATHGRSLTNPADTTTYYRPFSDNVNRYDYAHWDSFVPDAALTTAGTWMASRVPDALGGRPVWLSITASLARDGKFVSPLNGVEATSRVMAYPTSVSFGGRIYPALQIGAVTMLAADTDGDGMADAALWPLPVGEINGVRYYAAIRIIDNNSAINAAVALKWNDDYAATLPGNFFPTNINLFSFLLGGPAEFAALNGYRFNDKSSPPVAGLVPLDEGRNPRNDFQFVSPYDAYWMQYGRRIANPAYNQLAAGNARYQGLSEGDGIATAYRFLLRNPSGPMGTIENLLPATLLNAAQAFPYRADAVAAWFAQNFDYDAGNFSRRPLFVTRNPVSNAIAPKSVSGPASPQPPHSAMAPFGSAPCKTAVNTAPFEELWRSYAAVMSDTATTTPFGNAVTFSPYDLASAQRMFRSPLRDTRYSTAVPPDASTVRFEGFQALLLRSAIAAVNTLDLRDPDRDVNHKIINLTAMVNNAAQNVEVTIFGYEPQPFITEVFVTTDTATPGGPLAVPNPKGYVAIELHNPYPFEISLYNWKLGIIDRRQPGAAGAGNPFIRTIAPITSFAGFTAMPAPVIPANGYLVLENYTETPPAGDTTTARYRPDLAGTPANVVYVRNLHEVLEDPSSASKKGGELVVLRPRLASGAFTRSAGIDELANLHDMVPVDQFDFTGVRLPQGPPPAPPPFTLFHYVRANDPNANGRWKFVYPGRYDGMKRSGRHEGSDQQAYDPATPPTPVVPIALGAADGTGSYPHPFPAVQMSNTDCPGPFMAGAGPNRFPFGGFARNGDILQVPFIGAYTIRATPTDRAQLLEYNAVSMDSVFADDCDASDDAVENLGRMCPIIAAGNADDFSADQAKWRYRWATTLFDYFTVLAPHDDYLPNTEPTKYPTGLPRPVGIGNVDPAYVNRNQSPNEDKVPVEGLININTSHWKVLAAAPFIPTDPTANQNLAKLIVEYRNQNGPFKTLFDLYKVQAFRDAQAAIVGADPDDDQGDLSPFGAGNTDGVRGDFEEQFLLLNRVSNMLTTRSDSFTCYLLVQGWRNAGSANPELVVQRRVGFIADRTQVTNSAKTLKSLTVPMD